MVPFITKISRSWVPLFSAGGRSILLPTTWSLLVMSLVMVLPSDLVTYLQIAVLVVERDVCRSTQLKFWTGFKNILLVVDCTKEETEHTPWVIETSRIFEMNKIS